MTEPGESATQGGPGRRVAKIAIVGFLLLQSAAGFKLVCPPKAASLVPFRVLCPPSLWPFLDYNMYTEAHHEGEILAHLRVFATLDDGTIVELRARDFDMKYREFHRHMWPLLRRGDVAGVRELARVYLERTRRTLVEVRLEDHPLALLAAGSDGGPPQVLRTVVLRQERP